MLENLKLSETTSVISFLENKLEYFKRFEGKKEAASVWSTIEGLVGQAPFLAEHMGGPNSPSNQKEYRMYTFLKQLQIKFNFNFGVPFSERQRLENKLNLPPNNRPGPGNNSTGSGSSFFRRHESTPKSSARNRSEMSTSLSAVEEGMEYVHQQTYSRNESIPNNCNPEPATSVGNVADLLKRKKGGGSNRQLHFNKSYYEIDFPSQPNSSYEDN